MGLVICNAYHRLRVRAARHNDHGAAYVYRRAQDVVEHYNTELGETERRLAREELSICAQDARSERERRAWESVIELYDRAFAV